MIIASSIRRNIARKKTIKKELNALAKDEFQYSRSKTAALWGIGAGASALAGVGVAQAWNALSLPDNFGPAGMLIGGGLGALSTYAALGKEVPFKKRLALSLLAGAGSAALWNAAGMAGLKEGMGMAIGAGIGATVGKMSLPEEEASFLNTAAGAIMGVGVCHVAGIVGATGTTLGLVGASLFPVVGAATGYQIAKGNRRVKGRKIRAQMFS